MAETKGSTSLFRKLSKILGDIGRVAKNGRNEHHGYDYVTETDLVEAVRTKLSEAGIAYFFSVVDVKSRDICAAVPKKGTEGGYDMVPAKAGAITEVIVEATFVDGETGEKFSVRGAGAGQDAGDKGVYKAQTGAQKYILMKTFMIATGDDPEGDAKVDAANDEKPAKKQVTKPAPTQAEQPKKSEPQAHGPAKDAKGQEKQDDAMMKVIPNGSLKGRTVGSLTVGEAEDLLGKLPAGGSWHKLVQKRFDYLKEFEKLPTALQESAKDLDLELDKKVTDKEG